MDDMLKLVETEDEATNLAVSINKSCEERGFNLTKFISPSMKLLQSLPPEKRAKFVEDINIPVDESIERALGVSWCVQRDTLKFRIVLNDKPLNRSGMLSSISSTYDPDGTAGPSLIKGRKILQELTFMKGNWTDRVPEEYGVRWERWRNDLMQLEEVELPRCFKPPNFGRVVEACLHTFADASEIGYGMCSYLRQVNEKEEIHVSLVLAKSRVTPLKETTMPRLELAAAYVGSKYHCLAKEELMIDDLKEKLWVDSKIVLGYILNKTRRYKTYVANKVQKILAVSDEEDWDYIDTKINPADYCSRGISPRNGEEFTTFNVYLKGNFGLKEGSFFHTERYGFLFCLLFSFVLVSFLSLLTILDHMPRFLAVMTTSFLSRSFHIIGPMTIVRWSNE